MTAHTPFDPYAGEPAPGYYPDPSVPGFVRYWNGGWVPGTSRPAPAPGEQLPPPRAASARPPRRGPVTPREASQGSQASETWEPREGSEWRGSGGAAAGQGDSGEQSGVLYLDGTLPPGLGLTFGEAAGETGSVALRETSTGGTGTWRRGAEPEGEAVPGQRAPAAPGGRTPAEPSSGERQSSEERQSARGPEWRERPSGPTSAGRAPEGLMAPSARGEGMATLLPDAFVRRVSWGSAPEPGGEAGVRATAGGAAAGGAPAGAPQRRSAARSAERAAAATGSAGAGAGSAGRPGGGSVGVATASGAATDAGTTATEGGHPAQAPTQAPAPAPGSATPAPGAATPASAPAPAAAASPRAGGARSAAASASAAPRPRVAGMAAGAGSRGARPKSAPARPTRPGTPAPGSRSSARRQPTAARPAPAGLGRRVVARLLDTAALLALVMFPLGSAIVRTVVEHVNAKVDAAEAASYRATTRVWLVDGVVVHEALLLLLVFLLAGLVYEALPTAFFGGTPGKLLCGLRVVDAASGRRPDRGRAVARWICHQPLLLVLLAPFALPAAACDRPRRRAWPDRVAGTYVALRR